MKNTFNKKWYLEQNPDVAESGMDAYEHYLQFGKNEGRLPAPEGEIRLIFKKLIINFNISKIILVNIKKYLNIYIKKKGSLEVNNEINKDQIKTLKKYHSDQNQEFAYQKYIQICEPSSTDLLKWKKSIDSFEYKPKFSIVVPVYNVNTKWLTRFIDSVREQIYSDWELCIADDKSTDPKIKSILDYYTQIDSRINVIYRNSNGHISKATNSAMELVTGEYICLMDHDDEIATHALYKFAQLLNTDNSIDMIYSDEDKLDLSGKRYEPFFKPDWSPEALEGCMYTAHFACYRTNIVNKIGGFRSEFDGAQDYDFVLRFTEVAKKIAHIPEILYHWRAIPGSTAASMDNKNYVLDAAIRALNERAYRISGGGQAKLGPYSGSFDLRYKIKNNPLVSIVIPSAGRTVNIGGKDVDLLSQVILSIYTNTTYRNFEVIIVDNNDLRPETLETVKTYKCRQINYHGEFNIATKMNIGARHAKGEYILFMNDDIKVISDDWLECMLQLCQRDGVGIVGAKLYYENKTLQHVGVAFWNGMPDHIHRGFPTSSPGYFFSSVANRNYLAVTGAVLLTKRVLFEKVNGFEEEFPINYNDIDYCLKVFEKGFRVVYAAGAKLFHYESVTRGVGVTEFEINKFRSKLGNFVKNDPYYSSYFNDHPPNFELRSNWINNSEQ